MAPLRQPRLMLMLMLMLIPTLMATFDYPVMGPNCVERSVSTVSLQSLMLTNNEHVRDLATAFAARVESLHENSAGADTAAVVDTVYQLALSRMPNDMERQLGIDALVELRDEWQGEPQKALESYCHTILNSAAFLYVD